MAAARRQLIAPGELRAVEPAARRTNYNFFDNYATTENVFNRVRAEVVKFPNPFLHRDSESTVYVCKVAD